MRKYKKIIMLGLIVIFAVIFWEKAGILSTNKNYFSSFSVTPSKEEIIAQTRSLAEVVVVSAYDEFIVDTITYKVQNTLDSDDKRLKSQNLVKIKGITKASVPIKELTVFQIVANEDSIAIRLPKPEILSVKIDSVIKQFSTIGDDKILNLSGKVIIDIKDLLQKRAEDHQINSTATLQSINTLGNYYKLLGFRKVYFN
ncbi:MAG: DUF4230 domain-containing protein [Chitinophagaceae bacterium]|nr:DUF4230 domain-containing protein [Chitinophagaceae bacterium]